MDSLFLPPSPFLVLLLQSLKSYFWFNGQMLSSVAMAIHKACWQQLFEGCELVFFMPGGQPVNVSPSSFSGRLNISHHACIGSCTSAEQLRSTASCPRGRPRPLASAQGFAPVTLGGWGSPPKRNSRFPTTGKRARWSDLMVQKSWAGGL